MNLNPNINFPELPKDNTYPELYRYLRDLQKILEKKNRDLFLDIEDLQP